MPERLTTIPLEFWGVLSEMAPYLLFGFLAAGVLSVWISAAWVERNLGGGRFSSVVKAAALGVPLPLCSCGVIPVAASLRRHGAGRGATTAFLISTPQTGVDSILATYGLLGWVFAVYRPIAALLSGVLGGAVVSAVEHDFGQPGGRPPEACTDECCAGGGGGKVGKALRYGFVSLPRDIGRALLVGLAVAALISALVPKDYFSSAVPAGPLQILVLMLAGIPVYVCATASIPIAAALIVAGVSPGAAFAFLMTGPATNAATIATIWKVMGKRTAAIYLATMAVGAFAGGWLLDQFLTVAQVQEAMQHGWIPAAVKHVSAVALLGVLAAGVFVRPGHEAHGGEEKAVKDGEAVELRITGMTCSHCTASIRRALAECSGVASAEVDLDRGVASVRGGGVDPAALVRAVESLGYGCSVAPGG